VPTEKPKSAGKPETGPAATERLHTPASPTAPELSEKQLRHLRGLAHALKPVIRLGGAGLTDPRTISPSMPFAAYGGVKVKY